ncbi:MAG: hypothetical protein U0175_32060 [Caldilineaceae bacterium]
MNATHAANPYNTLNFDFESYEMEVEKGRRQIVLVLLLNMVIVIANIIVNQFTLAQQTDLIATMVRTQLQLQHIPNQAEIIKQMTATLESPMYPVYTMISQIALYLVIAVLPWVALYLGKRWARAGIGFFAVLQGITGVLLAPYLLWIGFYGFALLALAYGAAKLYTAGILFMIPAVTKYFDHANL